MTRPLILVDVDGVLNPEFTSRERSRAVYTSDCGLSTCTACGWIQRRVWVDGSQFRVVVQPRHGALLIDLARSTGAELAWGTTWNEWANTHVSPLIHLPKLPVAPCPWSNPVPGYDYPGKDRKPAVEWTQGRPFVWLDDAPDAAKQVAKLVAGTSQEWHVVQVNERTGLRAADIEEAKQWLLGLKA